MSATLNTQVAVAEAVHKLETRIRERMPVVPGTFRLRDWPERTFRLAPASCFYSTFAGIQIVIQVQTGTGWGDFSRDTPENVARLIG